MNRYLDEKAILDRYIGEINDQNRIQLASEDFRTPVLVDLIYGEGLIGRNTQCAKDAALEAMSQLSIEIAGTYGLDSEGIDEALNMAREGVIS